MGALERSRADAVRFKSPWCACLLLNNIFIDHGSVLSPLAVKTVPSGYGPSFYFIAAQHNLLFQHEALTAFAFHVELLRAQVTKHL